MRTEAIVRAMRANDDLLWHARSTPPPARTQVVLEEILEDLPEDHPAWWPKDRAKHFRAQIHPNHEKLAQSMVRSAQTRAVPAFRRVRPVGLDGAKKSVIELRDDGLAGCLRTPKGGSAKQMLFVAGKGGYKVRFMTPLECARLQGLDRVPEGFRDNEILFGLGDAVCVPAARHALRIIDQVADSTRALTTLWAG